MNITDILMSDEYGPRLILSYSHERTRRIMVSGKNFNGERFYIVNDTVKPKMLLETESEDEACRVLLNLK